MSPQDAFVLPAAAGLALVLLLTGLSLQAAVLHERTLLNATLEERQGEDALASAAQRLVHQLDAGGHCLMERPLAEWSQLAPACVPAISQEQLERWRELEEAGQRVSLLAWDPAGQTTLLRLGRHGRAAAPIGLQRGFVLERDGQQRILALRELGR